MSRPKDLRGNKIVLERRKPGIIFIYAPVSVGQLTPVCVLCVFLIVEDMGYAGQGSVCLRNALPVLDSFQCAARLGTAFLTAFA
jgi:hypothetical protein